MLYAIGRGFGHPIKIGRSADPYKRLKQLQTSSAFPLKMLAFSRETIEASSLPFDIKMEAKTHHAFIRYRGQGEWFDIALSALDAHGCPGHEEGQEHYKKGGSAPLLSRWEFTREGVQMYQAEQQVVNDSLTRLLIGTLLC